MPRTTGVSSGEMLSSENLPEFTRVLYLFLVTRKLFNPTTSISGDPPLHTRSLEALSTFKGATQKGEFEGTDPQRRIA